MFAVTSAPARLLRLPSLPSPLTATAATIRPLRLETGGGSGLVQGKAPGGVRKNNCKSSKSKQAHL